MLSRLHPLWLLVAGYWLWMIWACAGEWTNSEDYNYGWFVPLLALYFLWKRLEGAPRADCAPPDVGAGRAVAWAVIVVSLLVILPLEIVRQTPIHWRPNLWAIAFLAVGNTLAAAWLTGGCARFKIFLIPTLFMLVGVPWPTFVESAVAYPLMPVVTRWAVGLLHFLGYPATAAGTTITLPNCTVGVEEACSGLRSLQTALMVGVAAGELTRLGAWGRVALMFVAFVMALAGNQVRVLMLALAGIGGGNRAVENLHDTAGYVVLAILLGGVGLAATLGKRWQGLAKELAGKGAPSSASLPASSGYRPSLAAGWLAVALGGLALLGANGWYWWRASLAAPPSPPILAPVGDAGFVIDENVPPSILGILQPDRYTYIRESVDGTPTRAIGYHFYWEPRRGNANQLYHRPDRCMPGAGWRIEGDVTRETFRLGDRDVAFNVFPFRGPGGPALMLWGSYLNGEPVEIAFTSDVYVNTANLAQFIRTGTRDYSYEVAACIMPYAEGARPGLAEIEAYTNRVFTAAP
jgi:exosortase